MGDNSVQVFLLFICCACYGLFLTFSRNNQSLFICVLLIDLLNSYLTDVMNYVLNKVPGKSK